LILTGEAGAGKTHVALGLAAQRVADREADKIVISRPVVTAGEDIGYLKGGMEDKMLPWVLPFHDVLSRMTFQAPADWFKEHVEIAPVAFLRGRTFARSTAILDEAQNCTYAQIKLFLTRLGHKGKLILTGDLAQSDLPEQRGLKEVIDAFTARPLPGVAHLHLASKTNPRHPLIPGILDRL
jgi:phosphate starvation-inducible PhoH-like protein